MKWILLWINLLGPPFIWLIGMSSLGWPFLLCPVAASVAMVLIIFFVEVSVCGWGEGIREFRGVWHTGGF